LRRSAADAIKFADGDFDRAGIVGRGRSRRPDKWAQRIQILNRALAKGGNVADDERAAVILQRGGGDFRRGRAEAVEQDNERPGRKARSELAVGIHVQPAVRTLRARTTGPSLMKEAGELDGFFERAAGVAAQIENDAGDLFLTSSFLISFATSTVM
jgi:hypothetical protein